MKHLLENTKCRVQGDANRRMNKGRVSSRKIKFDGLEFASRSEMEVYREYKLDPDIDLLGVQPKFTLQEGFSRNGKRHRAITYTADFDIIEDGREIIVEVKSVGTLKANSKSYSMRKKLFLKKFPDLLFREIIVDGRKITVNEF